MQQAPSTEQYRKMFVAKPGWKLVDSDYSSAELFIAAISQETSSYCLQLSKGMTSQLPSFLIFGQKWLDEEVLSLLETTY
jgi:hypothetical protein